mmetsp:Transcript_22247/g.39171  ORF Transcript_22247/g.39171 Transcript_22247/m.39171 type:complete len:301 (-) Transcript_22247:55-957(-)
MVVQVWTLVCLSIAGDWVKYARAGQQGRAAEVTLGARGLLHSWSAQYGTTWEAPRHWPTARSLMRTAHSSGFQKPWALLSAARSGDDPSTAPTAAETAASRSYISCGGHRAKLCSLCTVQDEDGGPTFDHGEDWCNGDCYWGKDEKCHLNKQQTFDGIVSMPAAQIVSENTTSPIPEMNRNFSQEEKKDIDLAADRAIEESKFEADMAYGKAKEEEEENTPSKKFWFVVIITASVCLVCCACPAVILLVGYIAFPSSFTAKKPGEESEGDSSAVEDGDEEEVGDEEEGGDELDDGDGYAA